MHSGHVKRTGDGALVEFRSVVDAVRCAVEIQNAMIERNGGVLEDRRIVFRIGVHLGDVVEESDGDLMGDGVNIAARLEGIAEPGAICLSEDAYRQVRARLDLAVNDLGQTQLKNIVEPIRVFSLRVGSPGGSRPARTLELPKAHACASACAARQAVDRRAAVQNMSDDPSQDYCRFRFQCETGGVRELKALREMSPAAFSVSIETGSAFFRFQLGLIDHLIDRTMNHVAAPRRPR